MRILKYIGVFTPEPWQGYGFDDESKAVLEMDNPGMKIQFGDTHHPAFSETKGEYDGRYLFINDKANPRIAVIDLKDFETKQIVANPFFKSEHGGAFVTPNTEYIMSANSFTFELPPYSQDLSDAGKEASYGWGFTNSFCSERYVGGENRPPFEAGCSAKDTDFLQITNWKKAEELVKAGKVKKVNGSYLIPIEQAVKEGLLYLVPEPKSPHGVDVNPKGTHIIVSGKLDSHTWVYSWEKIQKAIKNKKFEGKDPYGIPIIAMKDALHTQVQVGLGPLHTQYDAKECVVYTSIYVDSMVTKWDYCEGKVLDQLHIHYNIGHPAVRHVGSAGRASLCGCHQGRQAEAGSSLQVRLGQPQGQAFALEDPRRS